MHKFHITLSGIYGSTALTIDSSNKEDMGGIDLSQIELTLKDEKFVSSLNPAKATNPACPVRNLVFCINEFGISNGAGSKILQGWLGKPVKDPCPK